MRWELSDVREGQKGKKQYAKDRAYLSGAFNGVVLPKVDVAQQHPRSHVLRQLPTRELGALQLEEVHGHLAQDLLELIEEVDDGPGLGEEDQSAGGLALLPLATHVALFTNFPVAAPSHGLGQRWRHRSRYQPVRRSRRPRRRGR